MPPADAVKAALRRLTSATYSYTVGGDYWDGQNYRASGAYDPQARKESRTYAITGGKNARTRKLLVIGDNSYELGGHGKRWKQTDLTRLKPTSDDRHADPADPSGLTRFTAAIHSTRRIDPNTYEGEARLEVTPGALTYLPLGAPIYRFEQSGEWVSYTLRTNPEGDVTTISTTLETSQGGSVNVRTNFSNYGRPVKVTKPL